MLLSDLHSDPTFEAKLCCVELYNKITQIPHELSHLNVTRFRRLVSKLLETQVS